MEQLVPTTEISLVLKTIYIIQNQTKKYALFMSTNMLLLHLSTH